MNIQPLHNPIVHGSPIPNNIPQSSTQRHQATQQLAEHLDALSVHEKLYYNFPLDVPRLSLSPVRIRTAQTSPKKSPLAKPPTPVVGGPYAGRLSPVLVEFGHEFSTVRLPDEATAHDFLSGVPHAPAPLTIVHHQKRGVKLPRMSPDHGSTSITRNVLGGFFAT